MKLIWITMIALASMMTIALTGCALPPQAQSEIQEVEENNTIVTKQADNLMPSTTKVSYATQRETPLLLPPGLTVEEYVLVDPPVVEPLTFHPVLGSQDGILARRYNERLKTIPDNSFFDGNDYAMRAYLGMDELVARQQYNETGSEGWVRLFVMGKKSIGSTLVQLVHFRLLR